MLNKGYIKAIKKWMNGAEFYANIDCPAWHLKTYKTSTIYGYQMVRRFSSNVCGIWFGCGCHNSIIRKCPCRLHSTAYVIKEVRKKLNEMEKNEPQRNIPKSPKRAKHGPVRKR